MNYFSEEQGLKLFQVWKRTGDMRSMDELLTLCLPVVSQMTSTWRTTIYGDRDDISNYVMGRLYVALRDFFEPKRGRLFSFISRAVQNSLIDYARRARDWSQHVCLIDGETLENFGVNGADHRHNVDDIHYRVRQVKTTLTLPLEQEAQRWLVNGLMETDFEFRRHECARAMETVFSISPLRSRMIFDLTLLAVRREISDRKFKPVAPSELVGTRAKALERYRSGLSEPEFGRLVALMRGLGPRLIFLRGKLSPREVLYGSSREKPLFAAS
jgi:hypothetical protein